jgi:hypothetical protein
MTFSVLYGIGTKVMRWSRDMPMDRVAEASAHLAHMQFGMTMSICKLGCIETSYSSAGRAQDCNCLDYLEVRGSIPRERNLFAPNVFFVGFTFIYIYGHSN